MNISKTLVSILLCALMLLGCMPTALGASGAEETAAVQTQKQNAEPDDTVGLKAEAIKAEPQREDIINMPIWTVSLTDAANPLNTLHPIGIVNTADWKAARDGDMERPVAEAAVPASGSYTRTLSTETLSLSADAGFVVGLRAYVSSDVSFTVRCTDTATGAAWTPYDSDIQYDIWHEYSFKVWRNAPSAVSGARSVRIEFICTGTVSASKGGDEPLDRCRITDLDLFVPGDIDRAANAPDSDLHFFYAQDNTVEPFVQILEPHFDRSYVKLDSRGEDDDYTCGIVARVIAEAGDVLSFEYINEGIDYMAGTQFVFGTGTSLRDMETIFTGEYEDGNGEFPYDWASFAYTIPARGEYYFIWGTIGCDEYSIIRVDNIRLTPRMTPERVLNEQGETSTYHNGDDTPWYPVIYNGGVWYRSGAIAHNGTSTLITEGNMLKAGDEVGFGINISSEKNFDKLTIYMQNTAEPDAEEVVLQTVSGNVTGGAIYSNIIPEDGIYTFRFVYSKDSSVSTGSDCAYLAFVHIPPMTLTHASAYDSDAESRINVWDYYPENMYHFVPTLFDGEVVIASDNQGAKNSMAGTNVTVELTEGEIFIFEYIKDGEANFDNLVIGLLDSPYTSSTLATIKPRSTTWQTFTYTAEASGAHTFCITYEKDGSVNTGTDTAYIRNIRVKSLDDLLNEAALYEYNGVDLLHHDTSCDGCFSAVNVDDRYAVAFTSIYPANAAFIHEGYHLAYEYVTFEFRIEGDASLRLVDNGAEGYSASYPTDGEWFTANYRIPQSGDHVFEFRGISGGGTVYIDNVRFGFIDQPLEDAIEMSYGWNCYPVTVDYENSFGFTGRYDPEATGGYNDYAAGLCDNGEEAELCFTQYMYPGDSFDFSYFFLDEDSQPNGSTIELYADGQFAARRDDRWCTDMRSVNYIAVYEGEHAFTVKYISGADHPGDTCCINDVYYRPAGITLDEALNVGEGDIHFRYCGAGSFAPSEGSDFYNGTYAYPIGKYVQSGSDGYYVAANDFELDVTAGDKISFDAFLVGYIGGVLPYGDPDDTRIELRMSDGENSELLLSVDLYDLYTLWHDNDYADEYWINHLTATVPETGSFTFTIIEYRSAAEAESQKDSFFRMYIDIDNVELSHGGGIPGDLDGDGVVTFLDVSILSLFLTGEGSIDDEYMANADFNGDGSVSYSDISDMYLFLIG